MNPLKNYTALGLIVFFLALYLLNKTDTGHAAIEYVLILVLVLLVVLNYNRIIPKLIKQ